MCISSVISMGDTASEVINIEGQEGMLSETQYYSIMITDSHVFLVWQKWVIIIIIHPSQWIIGFIQLAY